MPTPFAICRFEILFYGAVALSALIGIPFSSNSSSSLFSLVISASQILAHSSPWQFAIMNLRQSSMASSS